MSGQPFEAVNDTTADGYPFGGHVVGTGLHINWQRGPLRVGDLWVVPNGAFVETVIEAARQRLEHYQTSPFACVENACAIDALTEALGWLGRRTARRESQGTEGTWELDPADPPPPSTIVPAANP